jgi:cell division protein FtsW
MIKKSERHRPDFILLFTSIVLLLFGLLMVYNASPVTALRDFGDPFYLARLQAIWAAVAVVAGVFAYKINYKILEKFAPLFILGATIFLLFVFIPGVGVEIYGARRWISVGGIFSIQPAEVAKLAYVIYLASWLSKKLRFAPFIFITILISAIVLFQRDLGTTVVIALTGLLIYFLAEAPLKHFFTIIPVGFLAVAAFILGSEYRRARFFNFLDPTSDPQGGAYHINQILIALGSGGLLGVGLGQSKQKYGYIPEVTTDSIFAVVGNELGFIGAMVVVLLFLVIVFRGFQIALRTNDKFGKLLAAGISAWIGVQTFINLAGMVALLPLTGVPLPFLSYGGSSLVATVVGVAIILNISRYSSKNIK